MRILFYAPYLSSPMSEWPYYHMVSELREAGHTVLSCNPISILGRKGTNDEYSDVLIQQVQVMIKSGGCDFLFAMAKDNNVTPSSIFEIRRKGIPCVNFHCDDLTVPYRLKNVAKSFDLQWITAPEAKPLISSYGAKAIVLPMAANPNIFKRVHINDERIIGFIGSPYGARASRISSLVNSGIPVCTYGKKLKDVGVGGNRASNPSTRAVKSLVSALKHVTKSLTFKTGRKCIIAGIKRSILELTENKKTDNSFLSKLEFRGFPSFEEMPECYSRLGLSLGSIETGSTYVLQKPLMHVRLREFEAAMCGAVHIVNRFSELQGYFVEDREMLFYSNADELVDKARYYLSPKRDTLRNQIRQQVRRRAENDHTWLKRMMHIWNLLGIS